MDDFATSCIPQTESLQMNSQVFAPERVLLVEGHRNVTKTTSPTTTVCLPGASSAHAVEPSRRMTDSTKTGDFAAAGSDTMAAASLSANSSTGALCRRSAFRRSTVAWSKGDG